MLKSNRSPLKPIMKKVKKGMRGYPLATVAFYGPDDKRATKIAVGIILEDGAEPDNMERWTVETGDVRMSQEVGKQIVEIVRSQEVRSVIATDRIIGCPHEEGVDFPDGQSCPKCQFWIGRNRFSGRVEH